MGTTPSTRHGGVMSTNGPTVYIRNDDVEMIKVAPSQAVNVPVALRLHLVTLEEVEEARREMDKREAA
jgi:hypothetical protein